LHRWLSATAAAFDLWVFPEGINGCKLDRRIKTCGRERVTIKKRGRTWVTWLLARNR
jgi:hypothetical protein